MALNSFRPEFIDSTVRPSTPPSVSHEVEFLPSCSLIRRISESLNALPRHIPTSDRRAPAGQAPSRRTNPRVARPAPAPAGPATPPSTAVFAPWPSRDAPPQSPIETLASVAAQAESSSAAVERPAKRARSEAVASSPVFALAGPQQFSPRASRPATSHVPSAAWGARPAAAAAGPPAAQDARPLQNIEITAAESLLDLFHSKDSRSARVAQGPSAPAVAPMLPQIKTDPLPGGIWASSLPFAPLDADGFGRQARAYEASNGLHSAMNLDMRAAVQTHTPPDDSNMSGPDLVLDRRLDSRPNPALSSANRLEQVNGHHPKQLHSPQSLPSELEEPRLTKDQLDPALREELEASSQGLGISVSTSHTNGASGYPSALLQLKTNGVYLQSDVGDSQATLSAVEDCQEAVDEETKCARCGFFANSLAGETVDWLQCNGCQMWFHFACTGFTIKEIRRIDKFHCPDCKKSHGATTFVRKSARNRTNVDYSSLNEGFYSTVDENHEHRYIKHFKEGTIKYMEPENFPRLPPEEVTAEYFERLPAMSEPIIVPAYLNPRPWNEPATVLQTLDEPPFRIPDEAEDSEYAQEVVSDDGQDKMGMIIPVGLTVRRVADLHGPDMPLEVIDVKSQEGDSTKKWTVGKWADYYDNPGDRPIRNVISLEVSRTPLGKLIKRPKAVQDLDLQDAVWPESDTARVFVKFYVLMSVADCYTDFHIDFGGSSVYYHILKGRKVFFFIPPTKQNLKKYEEWNRSPAQHETFLPDQTKECYRVDLVPGDTMFIPSGWIHAVWTPEDSLVIGGNFLTRLHIGMQLQIMEIEKSCKVPLKYRYPHFQKVQWYTVINYLEMDPTPASVADDILAGNRFKRETPIWSEPEKFGPNAHPDEELYNYRYYAKTEVESWPELLQYIYRTVLIYMDRLDGVGQETRKAVMRSIPKSSAEPLELARRFAIWIAWKRGNEDIPDWAKAEGHLPSRGDVKKAEPKTPEPRRMDRRATAEQRTSHRLGPKKVVCSSCREKKIACKHVFNQNGQGQPQPPPAPTPKVPTPTAPAPPSPAALDGTAVKQQQSKDASMRLSVNSEAKRRWGKACGDCRRSKVSIQILLAS
jgi:F-box/leucine-rich repeat protein 10/11